MKQTDQEHRGGDPIVVEVDARLADLVSAYLDRCRADVTAIPGLLQSDDLPAVRALGDRMAGSGGAYGFSNVSTLGFEIERAAGIGDRAAIGVAVDRLVHYLQLVRIVRLPG